MRRLLIHADDFGLTAGVTRGITETATKGIVGATSAMVCLPEHRRRVAESCNRLQGRIGLHLQLTGGRPLSDPARIPSLVDVCGRFASHRNQLGKLNSAEVLAEWEAQWQALCDLGIEPSHIDTHHHVHAVPAALEAYVQLAAEKQVQARVLPEGVGGNPRHVKEKLRAAGVPCTDRFACVWTAKGVHLQALERALRVYASLDGEDACLEIGCHPGYADLELADASNYSSARETELVILCDPACRESVSQTGWTLVRLPEPARARQPPLSPPLSQPSANE
jgi:chitin disaccharide deacetylase